MKYFFPKKAILTKHSKLPWTANDGCNVVDYYGCYVFQYEIDEELDAEFVIHCVNNYDKLVDALKFYYPSEIAKKTLREIGEIKCE